MINYVQTCRCPGWRRAIWNTWVTAHSTLGLFKNQSYQKRYRNALHSGKHCTLKCQSIERGLVHYQRFFPIMLWALSSGSQAPEWKLHSAAQSMTCWNSAVQRPDTSRYNEELFQSSEQERQTDRQRGRGGSIRFCNVAVWISKVRHWSRARRPGIQSTFHFIPKAFSGD